MFRPTIRPIIFVIPVILLIIAAILIRPALPSLAAGASMTLSPTYGPPTSSVPVKGKGFKASELVSLTFDAISVGSPKAGKTGAFVATIMVPSSAQPGNHVVQAKGKSSGYVAQATFLVQTDWVQQGFNREHTGDNVFENVLNTSNVSSLTQKWWYSSNSWPGSMSIANGTVYFGCYQTYVCALSGSTGQLLWSHNVTESFAAIPAVVSPLVYMGTAGGHVDALNTTSGALAWSYSTGFPIDDSPLTAYGTVYVGASNGVLYALNGTTGHVVWTHAFSSAFATPSIEGTLVYVSAGGNLYALNYLTGKVVWHVAANGGTPVIANKTIYMSDPADSKLLALSDQTGALLWSRMEPNYPQAYSDPAVANGVVYVTVPGICTIEALSGATGAVQWQYASFDQPTCVQDTPIIANGVVYVGATDDQDPDCYCTAVYSMSAANGAQLGYIEDDNGESISGESPVVVVNGVLYYAAPDGVYAYHAA